MHAIGSNKTRYEAMTAWKQRKVRKEPGQGCYSRWPYMHVLSIASR